jgi:hypothetical protein
VSSTDSAKRQDPAPAPCITAKGLSAASAALARPSQQGGLVDHRPIPDPRAAYGSHQLLGLPPRHRPAVDAPSRASWRTSTLLADRRADSGRDLCARWMFEAGGKLCSVGTWMFGGEGDRVTP